MTLYRIFIRMSTGDFTFFLSYDAGLTHSFIGKFLVWLTEFPPCVQLRLGHAYFIN